MPIRLPHRLQGEERGALPDAGPEVFDTGPEGDVLATAEK